MNWMSDAACRTANPELFFPVGTTGPARHQIAAAKAVCATCPVIERCKTWALESGQEAGVWGGLDEDERRALTHQDAGAGREVRA